MKFCIKKEFNVDEKINGQTPIDLAYNIRNFQIILELLNANSTFPREFKHTDVTPELKPFVEMCKSLHDNIKSNNKSKVKEIIEKNPKLRHFYDLQNNSALTCLIVNRKFKVYHTLIKREITFGYHEDTDTILGELSQNRIDSLNKINRKFSREILQLSYEKECERNSKTKMSCFC